jgi:hypothetical protein
MNAILNIFSFFIFLFVLSSLIHTHTQRFELRASCLLGRYSTTSVASPVLFVLVILPIGYHVFAGDGLGP